MDGGEKFLMIIFDLVWKNGVWYVIKVICFIVVMGCYVMKIELLLLFKLGLLKDMDV